MASGDEFDELVSDVDYPMFIITTRAGDELAGCLAGFVTQASIDPPRLLVMLSKANHTYDVARRADTLVVHFLGAGNCELATLFGEQTGDRTDKFARCEWLPGPGGVPVVRGTRGWVAGRILDRIDGGDHVGHLLATLEATTDRTDAPLSFQTVRDMKPGHDA